jgi:hypothetical protein
MADETSKSAKPRGPIHYDLLSQPAPDFELMCFRLIRLEHPEVEKPADVSDGGADALLPKPGGGYARAWQAKHFPGTINWTRCRESFAAALAAYSPDRYTFCFPRNLTKREITTFDRHFRAPGNPVAVDYWNGDELQARLTDSDRARAVAGHFFDADGEKLDAIKRAALAKGTLDTPGDALDRMRPVGEFLDRSDPYFSYSATTFREGSPAEAPISERAIMSVQQSEDGIVSRLDVVPNDAEALELFAPQGKMTFDAEVYRGIAEALARGEEVVAEDVEVTWEQLPPALAEDVGRPMRAQVRIGPAERRAQPPAPWRARIAARNGEDRAHFDLDLETVDPPPDWEGCLEGTRAGLTLRILFRRTETGGESTLNYRYSLGATPAREQLRALRLLDLLKRDGGTMTITDRGGGDREISLATGAPDDTEPMEALTAFLKTIVEIEKETGMSIAVSPETFTTAHFQGAATVAAALRRGGFNVVFEQLEVQVGEEEFRSMGDGGPILIERDIEANVLDSRIPLGRTRLELADSESEVLSLRPDGSRLLRLRPKGGAPAELFERIIRTKRAKRPPPPPRKRRGKGGRSRRRRGRS